MKLRLSQLLFFLVLLSGIVLTITMIHRTGPSSVVVTPPHRAPLPFEADFYNDEHWYDGKAEVNLYDMTTPIYGEQRTAEEAALIFVNEDHHAKTMVKADDWQEADLPAVKLNWSTEVPAGIYTYRQMASIFIDRKHLLPFRISFTHHEWCGNTWKDLRQNENGYVLRWDSYFDGEASGVQQIHNKFGQLIASDALPALLRTLPFESLVDRPRSIRVLHSLRDGHYRKADNDSMSYNLAVSDGGTIRSPAGEFQTWTITLSRREKIIETYQIEKAHPHRVIQMDLADGSRYRLKKSERLAYWQLNQPKDRQWRDSTEAD